MCVRSLPVRMSLQFHPYINAQFHMQIVKENRNQGPRQRVQHPRYEGRLQYFRDRFKYNGVRANIPN